MKRDYAMGELRGWTEQPTGINTRKLRKKINPWVFSGFHIFSKKSAVVQRSFVFLLLVMVPTTFCSFHRCMDMPYNVKSRRRTPINFGGVEHPASDNKNPSKKSSP